MTSKTQRRSPGQGSLFQRESDGLWVATIDLGYTSDGKRRRKVMKSKTQAGALAKMREAQRDVLVHGDVPTASLTVERWLTRWLDEFAAPKVKPRTLAGYRSIVTRYLVPTIGRKRLDKLSPADVRAVHTAITGEGLSPTTAEHAHRLLSKALKDALRDGLVTRNVAALTDAPSPAEPDTVALTAPQAITLLRSLSDDPMASRWLAAILTGARQGELLGLRWSHVDLDGGIIDLAWSLQRVPYVHGCDKPCGKKRADDCPARHLGIRRGLPHEVLDGSLVLLPPKTKRSTRVVPMAPPLLAAMRLHRETTEPGRHGLVWSRPDGRPIDPSTDHRAWKATLAAAGLPAMPLHAARHTAASLLLEYGAPDHVATSILGHTNVVTTRGYQHVSQDEARRALARVAAAITVD